ncbi:MAG: ABC transporter ATP-binding protein [Clostridia bacterium]|nr:ABC transporter ATP-binding protein [Clostridia bacterium]
MENYKRLSSNEMREKHVSKFKQKYSKRKNSFLVLKKVFTYAKDYRWYFYLALLLDIIYTLTIILIPVYTGYSINCIISQGNVNFTELYKNMGIIAILSVVSFLTNFSQQVCLAKFNYKGTYKIRDLLFEKLQKVPISFIDNSSHGDLISRMVNDIDVMTDGFLQSLATALSGITTIIGTLVAMFILNIKLSIVIVILTPMSLIVSYIIVKKSKKYVQKEIEKQGDISGYLEEYIGGERIVKAFNHEDKSIETFKAINEDFTKISTKSLFYSTLTAPTTRFINGIVYGSVGLVGCALALTGEIQVGIITTFLSYANSFGEPFADISEQISDIQASFAAANRVFEILEEKDEPSDEMLPDLLNCTGEIELRNVNFSYVPKTQLIQNFNLSVKQGQKIAIVGPTGCGKSTLINLLMRFYDVNSGYITVSDTPIKEISRKSLRNKYGMVLQDTWLFNSTIRENIAYGNPNAPLDDIIEAAKLAGIHEYIEKLPNKYDTEIIEGGSNLSQGEKQLICIARVMLLKPPMLILDEATSNIDTRTEKQVQQAFDNIMKGRTSFVVAHRLSTITSADVILVMNKGQIIEQGTHAELLKKKGFYANLYNSQFEISSTG